jgi:hypothetical protein
MAKKFKKQYFLFGEQICAILSNYGIKAAVKAAKDGEAFTTFCWDEDSTPGELLSEADGWLAWMTISESQYNKFSNA